MSAARRAAAALAALWLTAATPAQANMTIAAQAAGGLTPVRTEAIAIEEEDLFISAEKVRVHYVFRNLAGNDIEAPILFPLPDLDTRLQGNDRYVLPVDYGAPPPIIPARVKVNGLPVAVGWQQRAYTADGREVTDRLRAAKIPLLAVGDVNEAVSRLSNAERAWLLNDEVIELESNGHYGANWIVRGAYRWEQRFPANEATVVDLEYQPLSGGYKTTLGVSPAETPSDTERSLMQRAAKADHVPWHEDYCMTKKHVQAMARFPHKSDEPDADISWTRYVLVTARNWQGPIGRFRLVVDKLKPEAVAAFCSPDHRSPIRQTGPTTYEVEIKHFTPDTNVQLLTVTPE